MKAKQITTYHVKGEAKTWEKALAPEDESKNVKMIESNVINLYPDFAFQTIEGFGGALEARPAAGGGLVLECRLPLGRTEQQEELE
mgnify:FL=1